MFMINSHTWNMLSEKSFRPLSDIFVDKNITILVDGVYNSSTRTNMCYSYYSWTDCSSRWIFKMMTMADGK
ncbi:MAG: hypothetical protein MJZ03_01025 [archaeon]|nr:hypothetical protein [archaeon]